MDTHETEMLKIDDMVTSAISDIIRDPTPHEESRFFSKFNPPPRPVYAIPGAETYVQVMNQEYFYPESSFYPIDNYITVFPTKVVQATNLHKSTSESDLSELLSQFGNINQIVLNYQHAYIEFENKESAQK